MTWVEIVSVTGNVFFVAMCISVGVITGKTANKVDRQGRQLEVQAKALSDCAKRYAAVEAEVVSLVRNKANWVALLIAVRRCEQQLGLPRTELHVPIQRTEGSNDVTHERKPVAFICERCGWIVTVAEFGSDSQVDRFWCPRCCAATMKDVREGEGNLCS